MRRYGQVLRKTADDGTWEVLEMEVSDRVNKGRPKLIRLEKAEKDMVKAVLQRGDNNDRSGGFRN